jgi:hypothetical protein
MRMRTHAWCVKSAAALCVHSLLVVCVRKCEAEARRAPASPQLARHGNGLQSTHHHHRQRTASQSNAGCGGARAGKSARVRASHAHGHPHKPCKAVQQSASNGPKPACVCARENATGAPASTPRGHGMGEQAVQQKGETHQPHSTTPVVAASTHCRETKTATKGVSNGMICSTPKAEP